MYHVPQVWGRFVIASGVVILLLAAAPASEAGLVFHDGWGTLASAQAGVNPTADPLSRLAHRLAKRAENTTARVQALLSADGVVWMSVLASALVFLLVAIATHPPLRA
jgi:disulfide bond formation protein DsbB